jgi:dephospho-CoA kinase
VIYTAEFIALCGLTGAGKSHIARLLGERYGAVRIPLGEIARQAISQQGLTVSFQTVREMSPALGAGAVRNQTCLLALSLIEEQLGHGTRLIILDSLLSPDDLSFFRMRFDRLTAVGVHAAPAVRHSRLMNRGRSDDPGDWRTCIDKDEWLLSLGIGTLMTQCDLIVSNTPGAPKLEDQVDTLMRDARPAPAQNAVRTGC